jgi:hypothetical protein
MLRSPGVHAAARRALRPRLTSVPSVRVWRGACCSVGCRACRTPGRAGASTVRDAAVPPPAVAGPLGLAGPSLPAPLVQGVSPVAVGASRPSNASVDMWGPASVQAWGPWCGVPSVSPTAWGQGVAVAWPVHARPYCASTKARAEGSEPPPPSPPVVGPVAPKRTELRTELKKRAQEPAVTTTLLGASPTDALPSPPKPPATEIVGKYGRIALGKLTWLSRKVFIDVPIIVSLKTMEFFRLLITGGCRGGGARRGEVVWGEGGGGNRGPETNTFFLVGSSFAHPPPTHPTESGEVGTSLRPASCRLRCLSSMESSAPEAPLSGSHWVLWGT